MNILKGQKVDITKGKNVTELIAVLEWTAGNKEMEIDGAAFLLEGNGRCKNDESFIFYGQPVSLDSSVNHVASSGNQNEIHIALNKISKEVQKIAFTLTIHEGEQRGHTFSQVSRASLQVKNKTTGESMFSFIFGEELKSETAIVVGELYLHNGEWKLNAIGSGFNGGLAALCHNFGIEVETKAEPVQPIKQVPVVEKVPVVQEKPEVVKPIIATLKKKEAISIKKTDKVIATLEWDSKKDLDLYCFYVTKNDEVGKVYYRDRGSANRTPYITLDGDSIGAGKETIIVHNSSELKYVLFAAYSAVSNGIGSFKSMQARAVVDNQMGQKITSPLFENNKYAYWVAIAKIDFTNVREMSVSHVESYSKSGTERSPLLYKDGSFKMNVGPVEFKDR
ncbi:TerD family protein [Neobacillus sp. FSL H8-0543]|uniref:TerD family protein n=1 Tax=Neobacillus sp. FSL H8-0543 TaxID=2954672 RepID=UPI00315892DC